MLAAIAGGCNEPWVELDVGDEATWPRPLEWKTLNAPLNEIWTHDGQHLWAIGNHGFLLYSPDAGETWEHRDSGTREDLLDIHGSADGQHLWVLSGTAELLYSSDAGVHWEARLLPRSANPSPPQLPQVPSLPSIWATPDSQAVFVVGGGGTLLEHNSRKGAWQVHEIKQDWASRVSIGGRVVNEETQLWVCETSEQCWFSRNAKAIWREILPTAWSMETPAPSDRFLILIDGATAKELVAVQGQGEDLLAVARSGDYGRTWKLEDIRLPLLDRPSRREQQRGDEMVVVESFFSASSFAIGSSGNSIWIVGRVEVDTRSLSAFQSSASRHLEFQGIWHGLRTDQGEWDLQRHQRTGRFLGQHGDTFFAAAPQTPSPTEVGEVLAVARSNAQPRLLRRGLPRAIAMELVSREAVGSSVVLVGESGTSFVSSDRGRRWAQATPHHRQKFTASAVSRATQALWAGGQEIFLRFDANTGKSNCWRPQGVACFRQLCALEDESALWAIEAPKEECSGTFQPVSRPSGQHRLLRSSDGGENWMAMRLPGDEEPLVVRCNSDITLVLDEEGEHLAPRITARALAEIGASTSQRRRFPQRSRHLG